MTTIHEVCAHAGMSPRGIYKYFASKDTIIVAIVGKQREESALIIDALEGTQDFVERLVDIMQAILHAFRDPHTGGWAWRSLPRGPAIRACAKYSGAMKVN